MCVCVCVCACVRACVRACVCVRAFASMFIYHMVIVSDGVLIKYYLKQILDHHWYGIDLQEKKRKAKPGEEEIEEHEEEEPATVEMSLRRLTSIF